MHKKIKIFLFITFLFTLFLTGCELSEPEVEALLRAGAHGPQPGGVHAGQVWERYLAEKARQTGINRHNQSMMDENGNCRNGFNDKKKPVGAAMQGGQLGAIKDAAGREAAKRKRQQVKKRKNSKRK